MTEIRIINYRVDMAEIEHCGLSLEIMDYHDILDFTDLDVEQDDNVLSDSEFKDSIAKHIYERALKGKYKALIQYRVKFVKEN